MCARRTTEVAPFPIATFSQMPYFLSKLTVLAPASERPPRSESDFLLLAVERADDLRASLGAPRRSLRVNFWPPESEWTDGGPLRDTLSSPADVVGDIRGAVGGGGSFLGATLDMGTREVMSLPPESPADMLGARLGGRVEG